MVAALYNSLPTLERADAGFTNRPKVFSDLAPLLAGYDNQFGVCLVHAHCTLSEGERMVSRGNVSEPVSGGGPAYPERWLADGTAYEFSATPTPVPSPELVSEFKRVVGPFADVLGLFYAGDVLPGVVKLERTEGRRNITEDMDDVDNAHIETGWRLGTEHPVAMKCAVQCVFDPQNHREHIGKSHIGYPLPA
jgi:hypothetical protein